MEPTPASIRPVPKVSAFANLLGKAWKSTPRMEMQVRIIRVARWAANTDLEKIIY